MAILSINYKGVSSQCGDFEFIDWKGSPFKVSTKFVAGAASACFPDPAFQTVFERARSSTDWSRSCDHIKLGRSGTDDMECSNPFPDLVYKTVFKDVCKIHDMCLKADGRSKHGCDTEFYSNMKAQCDMRYPTDSTNLLNPATNLACMLAADSYIAPVKLACPTGSCHTGGLSEEQCATPYTVSVYCDNACSIYRSEKLVDTWDNRGNVLVKSVEDWRTPVEIDFLGITYMTTVWIRVEDFGAVGGFMGCVNYNGESECLAPAGSRGWRWTGGGTAIWTDYGSGAWERNIIPTNGIKEENDPHWLWNSQINNVILFQYRFREILGGVQHTLSVYCDNKCDVYRTDAVTNAWDNRGNSLGTSTDWTTSLEFTFSASATTTVLVQVTDIGAPGGFMGCINYNNNHYCTHPGSNWIVATTTTPNGQGVVWTPYGQGAWGFNFVPTIGIDPANNPQWVWGKNQANNAMIFQFRFSDIISNTEPLPNQQEPPQKPLTPQERPLEPINNNHYNEPTPSLSNKYIFIFGGFILCAMMVFNTFYICKWCFVSSKNQYSTVKYDTDTDL